MDLNTDTSLGISSSGKS